MVEKKWLKFLIPLLGLLSFCTIDISAQNALSESDSSIYSQKISELEGDLAVNGIGNSRVYNLAAYHSLLNEKEKSIYYLQMAVESGLIILNAIVDPDLENARTTEEWAAIRKKIIGNWYTYYPFGDADYALELIKMKTNYLRQREQIVRIEKEVGNSSETYWDAVDEAKRIALENGEELDSLVTLHGWPRQNFVGQAQTRAAALILVYSDVMIQKKYISEIENAVEYGEIEGRYYAIITDKILVADGDKQLYGTQYLYIDSTQSYEIAPIENEGDLDKRRVELGLDSMDDYLKGLNVIGE